MPGAHQLIDADTGDVVVPQLYLATTFWQRFRGLQFRRALAAEQGLLLTPCRSIHTHWMRFSIDVAMLDSAGVVIETHTAVPPWHILTGPMGTHSILESAAGMRIPHLRPGCRLKVATSTHD